MPLLHSTKDWLLPYRHYNYFIFAIFHHWYNLCKKKSLDEKLFLRPYDTWKCASRNSVLHQSKTVVVSGVKEKIRNKLHNVSNSRDSDWICGNLKVHSVELVIRDNLLWKWVCPGSECSSCASRLLCNYIPCCNILYLCIVGVL